jgi:hypothetical protein
MPGIFVLPKLKSNSELTLPDTNGNWHRYDRVRLKTLAKDLDYAAPGDRNLINSVPTMWAAALTMEMGLIDNSHPLHRDTVTQWQGMLAAVALAKVRSLPLKAVRIDLEEYRSYQFVDAVIRLQPAETNNLYKLRNKNAWLDNYVWFWNDRPVGMTSPSTLVVSTVEGRWEGLPWWNKDTKRLRRPHDYLSTEEQALLKGWLMNLETELSGDQANPAAAARIIMLVQAFQDDLAGSISSNDVNSILDEDPAFFGVPVNTGLLTALNKPVKLKDIDVGDSHLRLIGSEGKNPSKPLLVIDPDITKVWNLEPQDIRVHKDKTLAALSLEDLRSGKITNWDDVIWRESKDLFLPSLTFVDRESSLPGGMAINANQPLIFNGNKVTPLIPLDSILLEYFTPEDLVKRLKFTQNGTSNTVRVTLSLPLSGINPQSKRPQEFQVYKDYSLEEEHSLFGVPVLEIWPNFRLKDCNWQEYYGFYFDCELGDRTFNVEFSHAKEPHIFEDEVDGKYLTTRLSEFPTYIRCVDNYRESLGIILIKQPPILNLNETWKVGVDFGTSFTNIYVNHRDAIEQLKINPQDEKDSLHLKVTDSDIATRVNVLFDYFIPERFLPAGKPLPVASILTTHGQTRSNRLRTIYDGRIYIPNYGSAQHREIEKNYIETDLKWRDIDLTRLFLHHLTLIVTAIAAKKGVKKIEWAVSYPSAFSSGDITKYAKSWAVITAELQEKTGIQQICPKQPEFRTESISIAQYFADREKADLIRSVCIDLGGGTADISLWQNNNLVHQCSVQLAGRHLFSQLIEVRPELLVKWFDNQDNWDNLSPDKFKAKTDVLLRERSEEWLKEERYKHEDDPDFLGFVRLVSLGIAGLYYYVGLIVEVMRQEGKYKESKIPSVYIGGNGSRLLNWLVPTGEFDAYSGINGLFNRILSKASGLEEVDEPTRVSKTPKDEVACGLVMSKTKLSGISLKTKDHPIAGEDFTINGQDFYFNDRLTLEEIEGGVNSFSINDLTHLKRFVDDFNEAVMELEIDDVKPLSTYTKRQGLDPAYSNKLWDRVDRELRSVLSNMSGDATAIREEPPFILGLKALLTVLAKEWAGH